MPLSDDRDFWEAMKPHLERLPAEQRQQCTEAVQKQRKYQKRAESRRIAREQRIQAESQRSTEAGHHELERELWQT